MRIKKSRLREIIQEEIENDLPSLFEQFESEEDRRSRYVDILTNNDPNDDSDVPEDFRKGFNLIKKPLDVAVDALRGDGAAKAPGDVDPEASPEEVTEILAGWGISLKMDMAKGSLPSSMNETVKEILSAGYAIVVPVRATFQLVDPEYWRPPEKLPNSSLSGCQAMAKAIIAGVIYKSVHKVYKTTVGKFDNFLKFRLGRLVGTRKLNVLAIALTPERVQKTLAIAFTMKMLRENSKVRQEVDTLTAEFCAITSISGAYSAAERTVVRFGEGAPGFIAGVIVDLEKELRDSLKSFKGTPPSSTGTPGPGDPGWGGF